MQIETYKQFYDAAEANIVLNRLQANGIYGFLTNEHSSTTLWHLNVAHGGISLMLKKEDFLKADKILAEEVEMVQDLNAGNIRCPNCNSTNVGYGIKSKTKIDWLQLIVSLLTNIISPASRGGFHCYTCGNNFDRK